MYYIEGEIEGIADLLFNGWTEKAIAGLKGQSTGGKVSEAVSREEAMNKLHRNGTNLIIPRINFKKALLSGIKFAKLKEGKSSLWPYVNATVFVDGDLDLGRAEPDYLHEAIGRNANTGQAVWTLRPAVKAPWRASFRLRVEDDRRNADNLKRGLEEAGLLNGVGSYRPEYGRFMVTAWKVVKPSAQPTGEGE